ncbi:MAG: septum site-determining protein MinC, partial [Pseudomonadota bacterium]|nr:septum site-determining protein MinC [Pseudomonadota bacterium]
GFKKLEQENSVIVLAVDDAVNGEAIDGVRLETIVRGTDNAAKHLGFNLHSVLRNKNIRIDSIAGIPVVDLPHGSRSVHIYNKSLLSTEPVRSGIKLENDGDVIVTSFVSDNAEIVATGNIHVYGEARGRLIAGSGGDKTARIFVGKFNAELIAIGGLYRVIEDKLPDNILYNAVMISLDNKDKLVIEPMSQ